MFFAGAVATRSFGNGLPFPAMIPFADCFNHGNNDNTFELVSTGLHLNANESSPYFTKYKYMNDYSALFPDANNSLAVKGRFNKQNFAANQKLL